MANNITELTDKQVLERLNIPDFRHLSKDKITTFFSMLRNMEPEVAKKAIEQFPTYANTVKEAIAEYGIILKDALADNKESMKAHYGICNVLLTSISKLLEKDSLTFEEEKEIVELMLEVETRVNQKDTENKKFILKVVTWTSIVVVVAVSSLAAVLGANSGFSFPNLSSNKHNNRV